MRDNDIAFTRVRWDIIIRSYVAFSWKADPPPGYRYDFGQGQVEILNPLRARILVAQTLANLHAGELAAAGVTSDDPYTIGDVLSGESDLVVASIETRLAKLERDAVAAAYDGVHGRSETITYLNDFARLKHGFDIVAKARDGLVYIEVKGTFGEGERGAIARLKTTRHKGRQLSHRWIWRSVQETARFSASASFFPQNASRPSNSYIRAVWLSYLSVLKTYGPSRSMKTRSHRAEVFLTSADLLNLKGGFPPDLNAPAPRL